MQKSVLDLVRDKSGFIFCMIFPVVLVFILGSMLASLDNADSPIDEIKMEYVLETEDAVDLMAIDEFLSVMGENESISLSKSSDFSSSKVLVDEGKLDAAVVFREPFAVTVAEGSDLTKNRAVRLTMQSFAREYAAIGVLMSHAQGGDVQSTEIDDQSVIAGDGLQSILGTATGEFSVDKDLGVNRSMIDYYAVMMIVMIAFMAGSSTGGVSIFEDRKSGTLRRIMLSPVSRSKYFVHALLGTLPQNLLQVAAVMIPSVIIYGAHYANTWQGNILLFTGLTLTGIAVTGVCMILGIFMKVNPMMPLMAVVWAMLFLSGAFSKEIFIPGFSTYLPTSMIREAAFDLTVFDRPNGMIMVALVSVVVIAISSVIGSQLLKKKELAS
jgi:ABC-2 type transport system permease protein